MIWSNAENATVRLAVDDEDPNLKYPNFTDEIGEKPNLTRIFLPKREFHSSFSIDFGFEIVGFNWLLSCCGLDFYL
jgi:hypothetical protein